MSREPSPVLDPDDQYSQVMHMLKKHAAAIYARGNEKIKNYQLRMQKNNGIEELM